MIHCKPFKNRVFKRLDISIKFSFKFWGSIEQWYSTFLAPGTSFVEDHFSMDRGGGCFGDDSSALHLLCTLFLLLHHLHLRSSGIRSWKLGSSALEGNKVASKVVQCWGVSSHLNLPLTKQVSQQVSDGLTPASLTACPVYGTHCDLCDLKFPCFSNRITRLSKSKDRKPVKPEFQLNNESFSPSL